MLDCWIWPSLTAGGYGRAWDQYRGQRAHRVSYEFFVGPIPAALELDHLCRNRGCVNPEHLEAVTHQENIRRGHAARPRKDRCKLGHPKTSATVYLHKTGAWGCLECRRAAAKRFSDKRRQRK